VQGANSAFRLLSYLILAIFFLPDAFQHGLFMDGTQYAVVAKNLSNGSGSFWFPFLSPTWNREGMISFMEQPPLFYLLESLFFKVFGNAFWVEKLFCFSCLLLSIILIQATWKLLYKERPELKALSWLPIILWFSSPTVSWVFRNNLIETVLSVFVLASVYFCLKSALSLGNSKWMYLIFSGLFIFCGTLTKGIPALFPVIVPILLVVFERDFTIKKAFIFTIVLVLLPLIIYTFLWWTNINARESLSFYFEHRLLSRIENEPTVNNRFVVLFWMLLDILPMLGLVTLPFLVFRSKTTLNFETKKHRAIVLLFFCIGLAGVLPLCLTKVQREMYYVPAIPFFALALSHFSAPRIFHVFENWHAQQLNIFKRTLALLLIFWIGYSIYNAGSDARDKEVLEDVRTIGKISGHEGRLYSSYDIYTRWDFQFYLLRYFNISLSGENSAKVYSRVYPKNQMPDTLKGYKKLSLGLKTVDLFLADTALIEH